MATQTVIVTGANRGIGLELCRQFKARGDRVIAVCRASAPELDKLGVQVEQGIDVADREALYALGKKLSGTKIDVLVANAGILRHESIGNIDFGSLEAQMHVNAFGPLRTVEAFLSSLHEGSKVALITSRMGSIGDNGSGGYYGYRMSKAALNAAGMSLAHDLKSRGIAVVTLHPGMVKTDMIGNSSSGIEPAESVRMLLARIDALSLKTTGKFLHANGETLPW